MRFITKALSLAVTAAATTVLCLTPISMARADQPESGLQHPYHVALGGFSVSGGGGSGFAAKGDYSFFRPTRHEAVVSVWYMRTSGSDLLAGTVEYRWRFGGHGAAYYALGIGAGRNTNGSSGGMLTDGFGYDLGQTSLELRSLSAQGATAFAFLVGYHF